MTPNPPRAEPKSIGRCGRQTDDVRRANAPQRDFAAEQPSAAEAELALVRQLLASPCGDGERRSRLGPLGGLLERSRQPLTADEERVLFRRLNYLKLQADAVRSSLPRSRDQARRRRMLAGLELETADVRRRIAESNIRLVVSIARRFTRNGDPFEELVSEGLLILLGAIDKFDVQRGFRFSTYATHAVQRHFVRATQRMQKYGERFVLTSGDVMAAAAEAPLLADEPAVDPEAEYRQLMEHARGQLSDREEFVLRRRFGTGGSDAALTLRETAAEMGISKERVRQIQTTALEKLKAIALRSNLASALS